MFDQIKSLILKWCFIVLESRPTECISLPILFYTFHLWSSLVSLLSFVFFLIFSKRVGWVCPWGMSSVPWKATWKQPSPQSDGGVLFLWVCIQLIKQTVLSHLFSHLTYLVLFFPSGELVQIMMATANENLSAKFCNRVLKFFTKLFQLSKSNVMISIKKHKNLNYALNVFIPTIYTWPHVIFSLMFSLNLQHLIASIIKKTV